MYLRPIRDLHIFSLFVFRVACINRCHQKREEDKQNVKLENRTRKKGFGTRLFYTLAGSKLLRLFLY